jgi:general secretion pathway protein K
VKRERGAALLLVVLLVSLLTVVVLEFFREAGVEYRAAGNLRDALQAHALARSGAAIFAVVLQADAQLNSADSRKSLWAQPIPSFPVGDFVITVEDREDLDGRFPLGALVDSQGRARQTVVEAYRRFLKALDLEGADPDQLTDALVDWIDSDSHGRYEHNDTYTVPNAPLEHVEDLSRIEGYGGSVFKRVVRLVDTRADKKLNVNTAPAEVLVALHPGMDLDSAKDLFDSLDDRPLEKLDLADLKSRPGMGTFQGRYDLDPTVESSRFRIEFGVQPMNDPTKTVRRATALLVRDRKNNTVSIAEWQEE